MSNKNQNAAQPVPVRAESELEQLRGEVDELRQNFVGLALLLMPHQLRNYCPCGKLACLTSQATRVVKQQAETQHFALCEDCALPEGWREGSRVSLGPAERETVRIANKLGCLRQP